MTNIIEAVWKIQLKLFYHVDNKEFFKFQAKDMKDREIKNRDITIRENVMLIAGKNI